MPRPLIFLHQYFEPEVAGSAQQLADLTTGLCERGYSIDVVTAQQSYSFNNGPPKKENLNDVRIHRVWKFQISRMSTLGRILSGLSFFLSAMIQLLRLDPNTLFVIGSDPPFLPFMGWFFKKLRRQSYMLVISDLYPDIAVQLGILNPRHWMTRFMELINYQAFTEAETIVVLGEKMSEYLKTKIPQTKDKIHIIHNWANGEWIRPLPKSENRFCKKYGLSEKFTLLFSGNLGQIYNFDEIVNIAILLKNCASVEFVFIGNGPRREELQKQVDAYGLHNIRFLPYQSKEELPYSLTCGDLALIPLKKDVTGLCVPGKIYYALAAGLPLLVIGPEDCEPAQIVQKYDCGWQIRPGNTKYVATLLEELAKNPSLLNDKKQKARACFEAHYTKQRAIQQYEALFNRELEGP